MIDLRDRAIIIKSDSDSMRIGFDNSMIDGNLSWRAFTPLELKGFINALLEEAIQRYGEKAQVIKVIEELSELTAELCKDINTDLNTTREREQRITDEIADVSIMLEQLKIIYNIDLQVKKRIEYKIDRLEQRKRM